MGAFKVVYKPHLPIPIYQFYLELSKNNFLSKKEQNHGNLNAIIYDTEGFFGLFLGVIDLIF